MTARNKFYSELRQRIGKRKYVAGLLGVYVSTLRRREIGESKITNEMVAALEFFISKDGK